MIGDYAASFLPVVLVPAVGLVMPAVVMGLLFLQIESEA
jgi:photosystem I subunit 8